MRLAPGWCPAHGYYREPNCARHGSNSNGDNVDPHRSAGRAGLPKSQTDSSVWTETDFLSRLPRANFWLAPDCRHFVFVNRQLTSKCRLVSWARGPLQLRGRRATPTKSIARRLKSFGKKCFYTTFRQIWFTPIPPSNLSGARSMPTLQTCKDYGRAEDCCVRFRGLEN